MYKETAIHEFEKLSEMYGIEIGILKVIIILDIDEENKFRDLPKYNLLKSFVKDNSIYENLKKTEIEFEVLLNKMKESFDCSDENLSNYKNICEEFEKKFLDSRLKYFEKARELILQDKEKNKDAIQVTMNLIITDLHSCREEKNVAGIPSSLIRLRMHEAMHSGDIINVAKQYEFQSRQIISINKKE